MLKFTFWLTTVVAGISTLILADAARAEGSLVIVGGGLKADNAAIYRASVLKSNR